ncbi:RNA N6-adenosine-methyltransferase mettl16 [Palaemon carinicauda]|uniref:RNA N6-adenosine-methyltransferase mettl16 n=1 Tax=Palaemon carinicauda TaxID=392227 RepID=UPI0035B68FBA
MSSEKGKSAPPKLHKFMHPRNPYRTLPSFKNLAQKYAGFRSHCKYELDGKVRLNFKDPSAVRELTTCLLDQDFNLKVRIPEGRLVPTLPLRFNYLLWIEDLLNLSGCRSMQKELVIGLDIGCGASCIYPLLAAKQNGWYMLATEADEINFDCAVSNVKNNSMENHIVIRKVEQDVILKGLLEDEEIVNDTEKFRNHQTSTKLESSEEMQTELTDVSHQKTEDGYLLDFMMCNPPFFGSIEETDSMSKSRKDRGEPRSAATGSVQETVTEGGEVSFICQMIDESVLSREKIRIFSSMIGTKSHVKEVKDKLRSVSPAHTAVVEFCQGRTMRWGIAWTFNPSLHLENVMSKKQMESAKPLVLMLPRSLMTVYTVQAAWAMINKWLHQLKITVQVFKNTKYFVGANVRAYKLTWLNQRRKRREQKRKANGGKGKEMGESGNGKAESENEEDESELENTLDIPTDKGKNSEAAENVGREDEESVSLKRAYSSDTADELVKFHEGIKKQKMENANDIKSQMKVEENQQAVVSKTSLDTNPISKEIECTEELNNEFCKTTKAQNLNQNSSLEGGSGGLECILKAKLQVKQCGALISLEAFYLRGQAGKDGLNQILQYMKNQLTKS